MQILSVSIHGDNRDLAIKQLHAAIRYLHLHQEDHGQFTPHRAWVEPASTQEVDTEIKSWPKEVIFTDIIRKDTI